MEHPVGIKRLSAYRWKIEKETFNVLKNQGYGLEHTYGHGHPHRSTVLTHLMMRAFLIDQIQLRCCAVFNRALESRYSRSARWRKMRGFFDGYLVHGWEDLYGSIAYGYEESALSPRSPP